MVSIDGLYKVANYEIMVRSSIIFSIVYIQVKAT